MTITADEFFGKDLKVYDNKMTETIQQTKEDIAILQEKLQKLEELQRTKSPIEKAFYRVYGCYPPTTPSVSNSEDERWSAFQKGYNASKEECEVVEEPTPQEPAKNKVPLYTRFTDRGAYGQIYFDDALRAVRSFLVDEAVIENENHEYITFTLQKSLLEFTND